MRRAKSFIGFLNLNFKPIMKRYYRWRYRKEIYKMLSFFYEYYGIGIHFYDAIKIMTLDNDNWTMKKATMIFGICHYCGFIEDVPNNSTHKSSKQPISK